MGKITEFYGNVVSKLQALSKMQKIVTAAVTATSLVVVGGGAALVSSTGGNIGNVFDTETTETEYSVGTESVTEVISEIHVKIETSSIDKDLKVKVVNENGELVTGYEFKFEVAQVRDLEEKEEADEELVLEELKMEDYESEEYIDDDKDGLVHIVNLEGGDYLVSMQEIEEIIIEQNPILAEVKGELEYKKVDVENEVKKESQINAAIEDTAVNNVVVESVVVDTLPLLPTNVESSEVTRDQVDMSNFPTSTTQEEYTVSLSGKVVKYCTSHTWVEVENVKDNASCTKAGSYTITKTCSICGKEEESELKEKPALGHTEIVVEENRIEAQIGVDGSYEKVTKCSICGVEIGRKIVVIPALTDPNAGGNTTGGDTAGDTSNGDTSGADLTGDDTTGGDSTAPTSEEGGDLEVGVRRYMGNSIVAVANEVQSVTLDPGSEPQPIASENTTTGTPYTVDASATIGAPTMSKVYLHSKEAEKITWSLAITDEQGVVDVNNIQFGVDHTAVAEVVQDPVDKTKVTIKGLKAGTANVIINIPTWTVDANGNRVTAWSQMASVVTVDNFEGENAVHIKDNAGNLLYIDTDCTKPATPAHFTNIGYKLYGAPKYTGWTIIDGKLYYYKADNTPATGTQVIGGVQYTFNEDGTVQAGNQSLGIDVSKWQGNINWTAVAQSGVKFAIIRCAYRGASTGVIVEDPYFRQNIAGATANGIKVGVYFFTQAVNEYEAVEEASTAIGLVAGYGLAYPIFIDTENATNGRANGLDVATRTAVVKAFCETVRSSGYKPGIYASKNWYYQKLDMSQLSTYNIWVAQYNTACNYTGRYDIWQYSSSGSIPGINGRVDVNIGYTNY